MLTRRADFDASTRNLPNLTLHTAFADSIGLLAPSVLTETFKLQAHQLGPFLAVPTALNPVVAVAVTSGVAALQRGGLSEVKVQKVMTAIGGCTEAAFLLLLTKAHTPWQFVSSWCGVILGHCCHDHGFESNKSTVYFGLATYQARVLLHNSTGRRHTQFFDWFVLVL